MNTVVTQLQPRQTGLSAPCRRPVSSTTATSGGRVVHVDYEKIKYTIDKVMWPVRDRSDSERAIGQSKESCADILRNRLKRKQVTWEHLHCGGVVASAVWLCRGEIRLSVLKKLVKPSSCRSVIMMRQIAFTSEYKKHTAIAGMGAPSPCNPIQRKRSICSVWYNAAELSTLAFITNSIMRSCLYSH